MEGKKTLNQIIEDIKNDEHGKEMMESNTFIISVKSEVSDTAMLVTSTNFIEFGSLAAKMLKENITNIAETTTPHIAYGTAQALIDITYNTIMGLMPEDSEADKTLRNMVLGSPFSLQNKDSFAILTNDGNAMIQGMSFDEIVGCTFPTLKQLIKGGDISLQEAVAKLRTAVDMLEN